jgi:hypothetical protein
MKTNATSLKLFVATLGFFLAAALPAAPASTPAAAHSVKYITRNDVVVIQVGSSTSAVYQQIGYPKRKLSDDVWVYFDFRGPLDEAQNQDCGTLLLTFANGRVADIKLVNDRALNVIVAQMKVHPVISQGVFVAEK